MRSWPAVLLIALHVTACAEPRAMPSAREAASVRGDAMPAASRALAAPASRFHLALLEADSGSPDRRTHAEPCAVRGRTLICVDNTPLVVDDDGVRADSLLEHASTQPSAAFAGYLRQIKGRWPDDAWLLTATRVRTLDERTRSYAYQWNGDRWEQRAAWLGEPYRTAPLDGGLLVEGVDHLDEDLREHGPLAYVVGVAERPRPVTRLIPSWTFDDQQIQDLLGVDGVAFLMGPDPKTGHLMVERMIPGSTPDRLDEVAPRETKARLWARSARDVVAFGGPVDADEEPLLRHFDGEAWADMGPPPGVDLLVAYGRGDDGTERVFAFRGDVLSLWERAKGEAWQPVLLPAIAGGESIDGHWVTDDDAWLHVYVPHGPGRLLRMRPVKHVADLGLGAPRLIPVEADDALPAAVPPTPLPDPPADSSPFHDAVVSYRDPDGAMARNALRLCPAHGRTLVCGVSVTPLVSTDDGVVPDVPTAGTGTAHAPLPAHVNGKGPSTKDLPPGTTRVAAHDRTSAGTERLFAYAGDALSLFERPVDAASHPTGPWHTILLPTLPAGDEIHEVWLANDDAWLLVWPRNLTKNAPHLMRMQPVKKVWTYPRPLTGLPGW
jgi:hypothetical protein